MRVLLITSFLLGLFISSSAQIISEKAACTNPIPIDFTVTVSKPYNGQAISCNGNCDAEVTVTVNSGGGGPYGFQMFDGDVTITQAADVPGGGTTATFSGLCADNFNFTVVDTAQNIFGAIYESCTEFGVIITDPNNIGVNVLGFQDPSCPDSCDGRIFANIGGGTSPLSILWLESGSTLSSPVGVCTGINTVEVTDANGCFFTSQVTVDDPSQIDFGFTLQEVTCDGVCDAALTSTPSGSNGGPFNFTWTEVGFGGIGSTSGQPSSSVGSRCENQQILLELEDVNGCPFDTTYVIPDVLPMTLTELNNIDASCANLCDGTIEISIAGGSGNYIQIDWNEGTIASPGAQHSTGTDMIQTDLCPNEDYFVTIYDDQGCIRSFQLNQVSAPPPFAFSEVHQDVICNADGNGSINTTLSGGTPNYTYSWSTSDGSGLAPTAADQTGLSGGTYQVIYEDDLGCRDTAEITLSEPDGIFTNGTVVDVSCFDLSDGSIDITTTGGNGGYIWTWSSTPNGNIVDPSLEDQAGLDSAVYSLNIVDALGCNYDTTFNLNKPGEIFFNASITEMDCFGDDDAIITLNPANGVPNYTINWTNPVDPNGPVSQSNLAAGTYTVTVVDANGCDKDTSIIVTEPDELVLAETNHTDITCFGYDDGTITLELVGGTPPTNLVWTGGSTAIANNVLNPIDLGPGTYTANVTDANGCTNSVDVTLLEPATLSLTISGTDLTCNGVPNGEVSITPSGGTVAGAYLFDWDIDIRNDYDDTQDQIGLLAGTYCVNIQDDNGCTLAADSCATIIEPDSIFFNGSIHTDIVCNGDDNGTITLVVSGGTESGNYDYNWSPTPFCYGGSTTDQNLIGLCPGSYTVTASDDNSCTNDTIFTIIEPLLLNISETHQNLGCAGFNTGEINITVSGGTAPLNVSWSSNTTTTPSANDLNPSGLEPGDYTATVTDGNNCTNFVDITITTPQPLSMTLTGTDLSCNGVPDGEITTSASGGTVSGAYTYSWTGPNGFTSNLPNLTGLFAGTYCVNIEDDNGCILTPDSCLVITEPDSIFFTGSTFTDMDCFAADNGAITLSVSGGVVAGSYSFDWFNTPACYGGSTTDQNLSGLCDGIYEVEVTDDNGCTNDTIFTVTEPVELVLITSSTDAGCGINNGTVTVTPSGGTVAGSYGISWTGTSTSFTGSNLTENGLAPDTYQVTVTDDNGCSTTANQDVSTLNAPTITIDSQSDLLCNSECIGSVQISISGGAAPYTIQWTGVAPLSFSSTNEDIFNLCAGDYSISVTDANLCQEVQSVTISEPDPLELTSTLVTDVDCFGNSSGEIDVTPAGGTVSGSYIFSWTGDNSLNTDTEDVSGLRPGSYCLNVIDDNGCSFATDSCFVITEPTELLIDNISSTDAQCNVPSGSISVTASGGTVTADYAYSWVSLTNPAPPGNVGTTAAVNNVLNDTYTVTVTDDNGCQVLGSVSVQPSNGPAVTIDNFSDVTCSGQNNGTINTTGFGGSGSLTYSWSTIPASAFSESTPDVSGLAGGTYVLTVTDGASCNTQEVIEIFEPDPIIIVAAITDANCFGEDGEIDITVSGGTVTTDYGYDWDYNGGASFGDSEDVQLAAGSYNVSVVDDNSCVTTGGPYIINEPTEITLATSSTMSACTQSTGTVSVVASGGTPGNAPNEYLYVWTNDIGTQIGNSVTASNLFAGCYDVVVTENRPNGCQASTTECISDNPGPTLSETHSNVTCFGGSDGSIDLTITSTLNPVTVVWSSLNGSAISPSLNSEDIDNLAADEYSVVATDNAGCVAGLSIDITEATEISMVANIVEPLCSSSADGTVDITINDAVLPLSVVSWSGPNGFSSTSEDLSSLEVGQYCLHVEDANGCSLDTCVTLSAPQGLTLTTSHIDSDCNAPTGQLNASATGGIPGYTFTWSGPGGPYNGDVQTGLSTGTYDLTVSDINGCTATAQEIIIENNGPSISVDAINDVDCFGNSTGDIFLTVTDGTPGYIYDWDGDGFDDNEDLTGVPAGSYTVIIEDAAGCSRDTTVTINEPNAALGISGSNNDLECNGIPDGEITINVTGGTADYTYDWTQAGNLISTSTNSTGNNTVTGLSALQYDVLVTDANGCTITDTYTLTEASTIELVTSSLPASCGQSDGEISVVATGGTDGFTYFYEWVDGNSQPLVGGTNSTVTGLPQGLYEVTVEDLNGCQTSEYALISDASGPTVTAVTSDVNCYGDANGTIDVTASGNAGFGYSWSGPNGFTSVDEDPTGLEAGNYVVAVSDINGCVTNEIFTVGGPADPISVTSVISDLLCYDDGQGSINITVQGGTSPYTFVWSGPNAFSSTLEDINNLEAGSYTLDITDNNGCQLLGTVIDVAQPDSLEVTFNITEPSCGLADGALTAVVIGGTITTDYTYVWTDLGSASLMPDTDNDITGIDAGNYQVDVTDDNGCSASTVAAVSNDQAPPITVSSTDVTCFGDADGSIDITINGTNTYTYDWDNIIGANDPEDQTNLAPGTYSVEVLESPTGCISTATATIVEPDLLEVSGIGSDLACFGDGSGSISITPTGGTPNYTFDWDNLAGSNDPQDQTGLDAGTYQITVTDDNGCLAVDAFTLIQPNQIDITATLSHNLCFGETNGEIDVTIANGVAPYQYSWDTPSANEDQLNLAAGDYTLTVTDDNGCQEDSLFTITEPNDVSFNAVVTDANCNFSDGEITTSVSGGTLTSPDYTYDWIFGGNSIASTSGISLQPAGTYTFIVVDDANCQFDTTISINNLNAPTITVNSITDVNCYGGNDGSIDVTITGGTAPYTYLWNPNAISFTQDLSNAEAGTYQLQVTDDLGCISIEQNMEIGSPDELTVISTPTDATCGLCNGEATLIGSGGTGTLSYNWSNGNVGTSGTGLCSGVYTVAISDDNGCIVNESVTINDIGGPTSETITTTDVTCAGDNDGTALVEAIGGTAPVSYFWPHDGSTGDTQNTLTSGTYFVEMTDNNGCTRVAQVDINEPTPIDVSSNVIPSTCGNTDGSITITTSGGVSPLSINWTNPAGQTTAGVSGLSAGVYSVVVTDDNGCSVTENITISDVNAPDLVLSVNDVLCNGDATGSISSTVTNAVGSISYQWYDATPIQLATEINPDLLNVSVGDYSLEITDAGTGCITYETVNVNEPTALALSIPNTVDASCDISCDGEATVVVSGGTLPYAYDWTAGATTANATNLCVGVNSVTITDDNGCIIQTSVIIDTNFTLSATVVPSDATCGICNGSADVTPTGGSGNYGILWSNGSTGTSVNGLCSGIYPFEVTDQTSGCSVQLDATINDIGGPTGETINITDVTCNGGNDGQAEVIPTGGTTPYTYSWIGTAGNTNTITGVSAGNYTLQVIDNNGCSRNVPVDIQEPIAIDLQYIAVDGSCGNADGEITIIPTGGAGPYTYNWISGPSAGVIGSINDNESGLLPGTYEIEVTDITGCIESVIVPLGTTDGPDLTMNSLDESCFGLGDGEGSVVAVGNGPFSYQWTSAGTGDTEANLSEGQYFVTVTDALGCVSVGSVQIEAPNELILGLPTPIDAGCSSACDGEATVIVTGGTLGYTFSWDGGQTSQTATGLCVGVNNVTVTDSKGCQTQTSVSIDFTDNLSATVSETDAACGLCDGEATVTGSGGSGNYTITWFDGSSSITHSDLCAGIYPFTLLDNSNGCSTDLDATINNIDGPDSETISLTNVTCAGGSDGTADVVVSGGTTPYTYLWVPTGQATSTLSNVPAGVYNLEVADSNNCIRVVPVTIGDGPNIDVDYIAVGSNCGSNDGSIDLVITGGTAPYTTNWSGPAGFTSTDFSETALSAGIYTIDVTDNNGCTETVMIPLSTTNAPTASVSTTSISCFGLSDGTATANGAGLDFEWQDGSTTSSISNLVAGEYFVTATDQVTGCSAVFSGIITEPDSIALGTQFAQDPLCNGDCNGQISAIVDGGTLPYTYGWSSSGNTTYTESGLCDGTVTLTITDDNGCTANEDVTLVQPSIITIVVDNVTDAQCVNSQDGAIDVSVSGGTGNLAFSWVTIPAGSFTSTLEDLTGLDPTTYELTVTDDNGCTMIETSEVDTITVVLAFAGQDTALCLNSCVVLTGTYNAPALPTFEWNSVPATTVMSDADTVEICPITLGVNQYTLTVSSLNCSHTDTINVVLNSLPIVDAGEDIEEVITSTQTLGGNPTGPTGSTYYWSPNQNFISVNDTSSSNPQIELLDELDYIVFVTDTNGCVNSDTIHVRPIPQIVFPTGFTPNGDGVNDDWQIDYIEQFPESVVEVYNRWGEMLFRSVGYSKRWDGTYNGKDLPVGTYYYIIELNDPLFPDSYSGPITIMR